MRPRNMLYSALIAAMLTISGVAEASGQTLRVGMYQNEPKVFRDAAGAPAGLFVDLLKAIAEEEGWTIDYVDCRWSQCLKLLEARELDLMPDVALTPARARTLGFHNVPALDSFSRVYTRDYLDVRTVSDLAGRRIAVLRGSMQHESLRQQSFALPEPFELIAVESYHDAFDAAASGNADGAVANHFFGARAAQLHGLVPTPVILLPAQLYFAAPDENSPHLATIDRYLERWRSEGESPYYASLGTWTQPRPPDRMARWLRIALGLSSLLAIAGLSTVYVLRREVRRRTEQLREQNDELRRSKERSQRLLEELPIATCVWTAGEHGVELELLNRAAATLMQAPAAQLEGQSLESLYDSDHPLREATERCFLGSASERLEVEIALRPNAPPRHCVLVTGFLPPASVLVHIEDVTDVVVMQRKLQVKRKLETAGMLAGGVAHDFNNLLTVINSTAQLALDETDDAHLRGELSQILTAGQQAADVTARLLAFSRDEVIKPRVMSLASGVRHSLALVARLIEESIVIETEFAEGDWVEVDPTQLQQIVMNLVVNARDALGTRGTIRVSTEVDLAAGVVRLSVQDDGVGMDASTLSRAFEPFFSTKERDRGTGFGLAIVFGAVEQANGTIDIASAPGEGTTVTITFPLAASSDSLAALGGAANLEPATGRILLVEDDPAVRKIAERILQHVGFEVVTADSVEEALAAVERGAPPDLLLTDVVMPGGSGIELAEEFRRRHPATKVVLMSGYTDAQLAKHGALGTYEVISKPFSPFDLVARIRAALT